MIIIALTFAVIGFLSALFGTFTIVRYIPAWREYEIWGPAVVLITGGQTLMNIALRIL